MTDEEVGYWYGRRFAIREEIAERAERRREGRNVGMMNEQHRELKRRAREAGVSLSRYVTDMITRTA